MKKQWALAACRDTTLRKAKHRPTRGTGQEDEGVAPPAGPVRSRGHGLGAYTAMAGPRPDRAPFLADSGGGRGPAGVQGAWQFRPTPPGAHQIVGSPSGPRKTRRIKKQIKKSKKEMSTPQLQTVQRLLDHLYLPTSPSPTEIPFETISTRPQGSEYRVNRW